MSCQSAQAVARAMAEGLDIRFGHRVISIHWHQAGADVTCENGSSMSADAIVCTLPLGVLKVVHCLSCHGSTLHKLRLRLF